MLDAAEDVAAAAADVADVIIPDMLISMDIELDMVSLVMGA